jgi:hypothetical protein
MYQPSLACICTERYGYGADSAPHWFKHGITRWYQYPALFTSINCLSNTIHSLYASLHKFLLNYNLLDNFTWCLASLIILSSVWQARQRDTVVTVTNPTLTQPCVGGLVITSCTYYYELSCLEPWSVSYCKAWAEAFLIVLLGKCPTTLLFHQHAPTEAFATEKFNCCSFWNLFSWIHLLFPPQRPASTRRWCSSSKAKSRKQSFGSQGIYKLQTNEDYSI